MLGCRIVAGLIMIVFPMQENSCMKLPDAMPEMCQYSRSEDTCQKMTCLSIIRIDAELLLNFTNAATTLLGNKSHQLSTDILDVVVLL
jgi:hypothetical protein